MTKCVNSLLSYGIHGSTIMCSASSACCQRKVLEEEIFVSWCLIAKIVKISVSWKFPAIQYVFHLLVKYIPLLINHWIRFSTSHTVDTFFVLYFNFKHLKLETKNFSSILGSFMVLTIPTHWQAFNSTGSINIHHDWNVYSATKMSPTRGERYFLCPFGREVAHSVLTMAFLQAAVKCMAPCD